MRAANTYRASKRNEAKARRLVWRTLDLENDGSHTRKGTVRVIYPFRRLGKLLP